MFTGVVVAGGGSEIRHSRFDFLNFEEEKKFGHEDKITCKLGDLSYSLCLRHR